MRDIGKDFTEDVKIDKHSLADCAEEQPSIYQWYLEETGELKKKKDRQKEKIEYLEAEKDIDIRRNPPEGLKVTEAVVKNLVKTDPKIEEEREELRSIQEDLVAFESAVSALEHRNSQLKVLKDLWISGYYSDPDSSGSIDVDRKNLNRRRKNG